MDGEIKVDCARATATGVFMSHVCLRVISRASRCIDGAKPHLQLADVKYVEMLTPSVSSYFIS